ncbi:MAG: YoaK family protein [Lachnospiraceae bacterium]
MKVKSKLVMQAPVHETFTVGALLAIVGGFLDAYTYLLCGGVFANAQTGNIVLLSVSVAQGELHRALYYIAPILAFVAGVFITEWVKKKLTQAGMDIWEHFVLLIEFVLLLVIGFVPRSAPDGIINVMISFICSMQVNSFRKIHAITYASTMCTGNLRSGTENLFRYLEEGNKRAGKNAIHYFGIIAFFIIGAVAGTVLSHEWGVKSVWVCCGILAVTFLKIANKAQ